jgi:hypothetical protein
MDLLRSPSQFTSPAILRLCVCPECCVWTTLDPVTQNFISGKLLGPKEYKEHRNRHLETHLTPVTSLSADSDLSNGHPLNDSETPAHIAERPRELRKVKQRQADPLPGLLKQIREAVEKRAIASVVNGPLVFVTSPSLDNTPSAEPHPDQKKVNTGQLAPRFDA